MPTTSAARLLGTVGAEFIASDLALLARRTRRVGFPPKVALDAYVHGHCPGPSVQFLWECCLSGPSHVNAVELGGSRQIRDQVEPIHALNPSSDPLLPLFISLLAQLSTLHAALLRCEESLRAMLIKTAMRAGVRVLRRT